MEVQEPTPPQTLVSFIASIGAKRGVRMMRAIRAADTESTRLHDPFSLISSEFDLRVVLNADELHGAAVMYEYLHPLDTPLVEGRENGIHVLNAFRRAMRTKLLPHAYSMYFRDTFTESGSITELRKNLSGASLAGARYVFDYLCPEDFLPQSSDCDEDEAQSRRFSLRASLLNDTDLALGWVTLLEFASMRLVLRWSEMPSIIRDGDDEDLPDMLQGNDEDQDEGPREEEDEYNEDDNDGEDRPPLESDDDLEDIEPEHASGNC